MEAPLAIAALASFIFGIFCLFVRAKVEKKNFTLADELRTALGASTSNADAAQSAMRDARLWRNRFVALATDFLVVNPRDHGFKEEAATVNVDGRGQCRWSLSSTWGEVFIINSHPKSFPSATKALEHFRFIFPQRDAGITQAWLDQAAREAARETNK